MLLGVQAPHLLPQRSSKAQLNRNNTVMPQLKQAIPLTEGKWPTRVHDGGTQRTSWTCRSQGTLQQATSGDNLPKSHFSFNAGAREGSYQTGEKTEVIYGRCSSPWQSLEPWCTPPWDYRHADHPSSYTLGRSNTVHAETSQFPFHQWTWRTVIQQFLPP